MIKMVITDLDDTLLHSDKSISAYTISVLRQCQAKGIRVVFATARSTQASARFLTQFMPDVFVGYGGALVTSGSEALRKFDIPAAISHQLIRECLNTPEITSVLAINECVALTNNPKELEASDSSHYRYADFSEDYGCGYLKISVVASSPEAVERIASHYPMCDMLRYTGEDLYRFANRRALKWNAVQAIAAHYHADTDSFAAFGDDRNDVEMIENCGYGVAVANAIDEVKAAAKYMCGPNNDDGVAKWLEEHALQASSAQIN